MAKLPKATGGHLLVAVRNRGCRERGMFGNKIGRVGLSQLGVNGGGQGWQKKKKKNAVVEVSL